MKKITLLGVLAACSVILASCSKDNGNTTNPDPAVSGNTEFVFKAPASFSPTRAGDTFDPAQLRIMAFRNDQNSTNVADHIYAGDVDFINPRWEDGMIKASADLEFGSYYFVPVYDAEGKTAISTPTAAELADVALNSDILMQHLTTTTGLVPEIFSLNLAEGVFPAPHIITLNGQTQTVNMQLKRSVGRVDVYFIGGERDDSEAGYSEVVGKQVFGGFTVSDINLDFTGVNTRMNVMGTVVDNDPTLNPVAAYSYANSSPAARLILGDSDTSGVLNDFEEFDNITVDDVLRGSQYFVGPYLFPKNDTDPSIGLSIQIQNTTGAASLRTINLSNEIPIVQNAVTIVKIYVLSENVFTTQLDFEVEFDTEWAEPNEEEDIIF